MSFGFVNNFEQILAAAVADTDTTITLITGGSLIGDASADKVYVLTLFKTDSNGNETAREIVHVTAVSGDILTVTRAQEGTTAQAWAIGDGVSQRLTAGLLGAMALQSDMAFGENATATGASSFAGGSYATATGQYALAMGRVSEAEGASSVALGGGAARADRAFAVGLAAVAGSGKAICLGSYGKAYGLNAISVGYGATAGVNGGAADDSVAIGRAAEASYACHRAVAIGRQAESTVVEAVTLGAWARSGIVGGLRVHGLPYLPDAYVDDPDATAVNSVRRNAQQVVIATDPLDLSSGSAAVTLDLPTGTWLFIDSIDVIVLGNMSGTPELQVGPDGVTPAAYLASTPVTKTAARARETHAPLVADGVSSLRAATSVAGGGTVKVVFRGYVMEL